MAGEIIYNPFGIAMDSPHGSKTAFPSGALTPGSDGSLTSTSMLLPTIDQNSYGYEDIRTLEGKYNIDIAKTAVTYRKELFPFSWFADVNAKGTSTGGDVHTQTENYDDDIFFHDMDVHKLRIASNGTADSGFSLNKPLAINSNANYGGMLKWRPLTTSAFADINTLLVAAYADSVGPTSTAAATLVNKTAYANDSQLFAAAANTGEFLEGHKILPLGWSLAASGEGSRSFGGLDAQATIAKIEAMLQGNHYKKIGYDTKVLQTASAGQRIYGYIHEKGQYATQPVCTVHAMFDDICVNIAGVETQLHELAVRIHGLLFTADYKEMVLLLDFEYANLEDITLDPTAANNIILLEELKQNSTNFSGGFTRISNHALLGMFTTVPDPIAQGSDLGANQDFETGYLYDMHIKENFAQIIQSGKHKITGTYLASQSKFNINFAQKQRDKLLMQFKGYRTNVALYGPGASHRRDAAGNIINTSAGLFCYQHNPIRYTRQTFAFSAAANRLESIRTFVNNYARSVFAFQPDAQKNGVRKVLISKYMHQLLDEYLKVAQTEQNYNIMGQYTGMQPKVSGTQIDLSAHYTSVKTSYGTLEFAVDHALDYMTEQNLPGFVSTTKINPKYMMLAVDPSKISTVSLRAPRLRGNIQTNSADFSMEDMICEETLEVLNPMSHMVTLVNKI